MQIHDVEQGTEEWFALRAGKPTASEFSKIITGTGKASTQLNQYAAQLAAETYIGFQADAWEGNQWTERGKLLEDEARSCYAFENNCEVQVVGFCSQIHIGCSPDGLIGDDGGLEIKCLKADQHVMALDFFNRNGKCEAKYIPQIQGSMYVTARDWWDLYYYHPDMPSLRLRIAADGDFMGTLRNQVDEVLMVRDRMLEALK